jgi:hypothetical protein
MVALLKSEHHRVRYKVRRINTLETPRNNVAFGDGGFYAFRDKTTRQKWPVSTQTVFPKRLILSIR